VNDHDIIGVELRSRRVAKGNVAVEPLARRCDLDGFSMKPVVNVLVKAKNSADPSITIQSVSMPTSFMRGVRLDRISAPPPP
jgi:hypothetical protein